MSKAIDAKVLAALFTIAGGEATRAD
jgi:hypothetical protein